MATTEEESWLLRWAQTKALWAKIKARIDVKADDADVIALQTSYNELIQALSAEVQRATTAENQKANKADVYTETETDTKLNLKADKTALNTEATTRKNEDDAIKALLSKHEEQEASDITSLQTAITNAIATAKAYTDSAVVGSTKWMGVCKYSELPKNPNKGEFWTISDKQNKEFIWNGEQWMDIGADVDFTEMQTAINNLSTNLALKADKTSVYTKTESDALYQPKGDYLTGIPDGSVTTAKLADGAVTTIKLKDGNVTTEKIAGSAVNADKLASNAVTTAKLKDGSVTTAKVADGNITTDKVKDNAITNAKLAVDAVATANIKDGNVTESKLASALATKINAKANDANVVHKSGNEEVKGMKTFKYTDSVGRIDFGNKASLQSFNNTYQDYIKLFASLKADTTAKDVDGMVLMLNTARDGNGNFSDLGWLCLRKRKDGKEEDIAKITTAQSNSADAITNTSNVIPTGGAIYNYISTTNYTKSETNTKLNTKASETKKRWRWVEVGKIISNIGIDQTSGKVITPSNTCATDYIAIPANSKIRVYMFTANAATIQGIAFYNSSKTYISGKPSATSGAASSMTEWTFTTPANTAYLRFAVASNYQDLGYPYLFVEEETTLTDYVAEDSEVGYVTEQMIEDLFKD